MNDVSCPVCNDTRFKVERAEGNPDEAHFDAICHRCGLKMRVVVIPASVIGRLESMAPPEERPVLEAPCPFCKETGASFHFRCHIESGADFDVVTCRHCRRCFRSAVNQ